MKRKVSDKNKCQQNIETTKKTTESHNKQQLSEYKLTNSSSMNLCCNLFLFVILALAPPVVRLSDGALFSEENKLAHMQQPALPLHTGDIPMSQSGDLSDAGSINATEASFSRSSKCNHGYISRVKCCRNTSRSPAIGNIHRSSSPGIPACEHNQEGASEVEVAEVGVGIEQRI